MASSKALYSLVLLLALLPMVARGDDDDDHFPRNETAFYEKLCSEVDCGKGRCIGNKSYPLNFYCQCEPGWKQDQYDDAYDDHRFLPCVIPNCTLNYGTCQPAPPPVPSREAPHNESFFDPCTWMYCGEGKCTNNGTYRHHCECNAGFYNLLNISYYPCYSQCTLGSDCNEIIRVASATSGGSATPGNPDPDKGVPEPQSPKLKDELDVIARVLHKVDSSSILPGNFHWMIILLVAMLMALK